MIDRVIEVNKPNIPISDIDKYHKTILNLISFDEILPTGFSTSPLISNSVLIEFDNIFYQYCLDRGIVYTRYSDDIIVSSKNEFDIDVEKIISKFLEELYGNSFILNPSKSRYSHIGQRIKTLGMVVLQNGEITIDRKQKKEIEVLLHFYREDYSRFRDIIGGDLDKGFARISGILNYIKNIDENYYHKLMSKYGVTTVDILTKKAKK
jgi:RNA-directed DNA polymerase